MVDKACVQAQYMDNKARGKDKIVGQIRRSNKKLPRRGRRIEKGRKTKIQQP